MQRPAFFPEAPRRNLPLNCSSSSRWPGSSCKISSTRKRDLWHFHFYGKTPLALVRGRERIYFEHFWNDFAADPTHSVPERDRRIYAKAYARPGGMRAGFEYFRAFERDAKEFALFAQTPLSMPMLVLTGEKASGDFLIQQGRLVATNVEGVVVRNSGHWLMEEAPDQVISKLIEFLNR